MSKRPNGNDSDLVAAATSLDEELRRFEKLADNIRAAPFASQKNLERAAEILRDVSASDQELSNRVTVLVQAIARVRDRQQQQAELIQKRATELQERAQVFQSLIESYGTLGRQAAELNELLATTLGGQKHPQRTPELEAGLQTLAGRLTEVAASAEELAQRAEQVDFGDVQRMAESLRQQILSTKNKLNILRKQLGIEVADA